MDNPKDRVFTELEIEQRKEAALALRVLDYLEYLTERGIFWCQPGEALDFHMRIMDIGDAESIPDLDVLSALYENYKIAELLAKLSLLDQRETAVEQSRFMLRNGLAHSRRLVIRTLAKNGRWEEPWIGLVEREFPGRKPSRRFLKEALRQGQQRLQEREATQALEVTPHTPFIDEINDFAKARNCALNGRDQLIVFIVAASVKKLRSPETSANAVTERANALDAIAKSSSPTNPIWSLILDNFIPI